MEGLGSLVSVMGKPVALFKEVEGIGFRHLDLDVTSDLANSFELFARFG